MTGKLFVKKPNIKEDNTSVISFAQPRFFGGSFIAPSEKDKIVITPESYDKKRVSVTTMHISCKSDMYNPSHNYGGVIVYQYDGKSEWRTANNTHCKSGYIVIQATDKEDVRKWENEPGVVHGAVYRNAFGESVNDAEVVGEGFAMQNGDFKMYSSVFNNPSGSAYHDHRRRMHELSEHCVRKIVEYWKTAGPCWVRQRNFEVKELLKDFDFDSLY
ncbi:uncharacterized protein LOC114522642 [Dendronephthya gigantea]|uniref:uncharacterized protein LOC114522642 n=1 Tax=Dendronephthya gigantea TaxID=151771 RepID=UPI00106C04D6|nr:uncharacterized protein LOC114522642 [Dendronephthya gigantea]